MKLDKIIKILIGVWIVVLIIGAVNIVYFTGKNNKIQPSVKIEKCVEEKPSYNYLSSVTVFIKGKTFDCKKNEFKTLYIGTGVIIAETEYHTYILTNAHIAKNYTNNRKKVYLFIEDNNLESEVLATTVKRLPFLDLAVLRIRGKLINKHPIKGFGEPKIGEKAYMVGHHLGMKYIYGEGAVSGRDGLFLVVQIPTLWGNSGSGVFNKKGEMIGIIHSVPYVIVGFYSVYDIVYGYATDSIDIELFLKSIPELKSLDILNK